MSDKLPQVAIVGRANVGKSTLFNRLIEQNKALVSSVAGTTRDRNIGIAEWRGVKFTLVDTGGLDVDLIEGAPEEIALGIIKQARQAIKTAKVIIFVIDLKTGILTSDRELAKSLLRQGLRSKILVVGNKAESARYEKHSAGVERLGLGQPLFVSAASGSGTGDLLDEIVKKLPPQKSAETAGQEPIRVALLGKPNVGKSSLLNSILGEERVIVSPLPHTTREAHDTEFEYHDRKFVIIDTAGLRKKARVEGGLEKKSVAKSLKALAECDVAVLVTEADKKIDVQDKKITQAILESGKSVIIVANKWDLIGDKDTATIDKFVDYYRLSFPYLWWAPLIFVSAKENLRSKKILDVILEIIGSRLVEISDSRLDKFLKSKIKQHRPSRGKGLKNPYIYSIRQGGTNPPRFIINVNDPATLHFSYLRFLQNNLRDTFKIIGTPIQIEMKKWGQNKLQK
ncbi:MAG: ribosome biogenesis GTPase Der [Candidatus Buchananbacteria bacterium]